MSAPLQPLLREELDIARARLWAESAARVFAVVAAEARANVRLGRRTPAQAFAVCRRKFDSLSQEYFARRSPWGTTQATEADWKACGPVSAYEQLYRDLFPTVEVG